MRDYRYIYEDGTVSFVSDLPTPIVQKLLLVLLVLSDAEPGETIDNVRFRLEIELVARRIEGRL